MNNNHNHFSCIDDFSDEDIVSRLPLTATDKDRIVELEEELRLEQDIAERYELERDSYRKQLKQSASYCSACMWSTVLLAAVAVLMSILLIYIAKR